MSTKKLSTGEEVIVFNNPLNATESYVKVRDHNPFKNLAFSRVTPTKNSGAEYEYNLQTSNKEVVISQYFPKSKHLSNGFGKLGNARVESSVQPREKFTTITYYLTFFNEDNSILGIKSKLVIVTINGEVISNFAEKEQPTYSPRLTSNGKFVALIEGDIAPESSDVLFQRPALKIYELKSNRKVFEVPSTDDTSVLPPSAFDNIFVLIQRKFNGYYLYRFVDPELRVIYSRNFSRQEIGSFAKFSSNGIMLKTNLGEERLLSFDKDFGKETF